MLPLVLVPALPPSRDAFFSEAAMVGIHGRVRAGCPGAGDSGGIGEGDGMG